VDGRDPARGNVSSKGAEALRSKGDRANQRWPAFRGAFGCAWIIDILAVDGVAWVSTECAAVGCQAADHQDAGQEGCRWGLHGGGKSISVLVQWQMSENACNKRIQEEKEGVTSE